MNITGTRQEKTVRAGAKKPFVVIRRPVGGVNAGRMRTICYFLGGHRYISRESMGADGRWHLEAGQ
jgi:hypothetical protein